MTLEQMDETMTVDEYRSWIAFYLEEPFGEVRADLRAGVISATMARVMGGKGSKRHTPLDFMPIVRQQLAADEAARPKHDALQSALRAGLGRLKVRTVKIKRS
jgi:hypothetical protein